MIYTYQKINSRKKHERKYNISLFVSVKISSFFLQSPTFNYNCSNSSNQVQKKIIPLNHFYFNCNQDCKICSKIFSRSIIDKIVTDRVTTNLKTREDPDTIKRAEVLNRGTGATPFGSAPRNSISRLFRHVMR